MPYKVIIVTLDHCLLCIIYTITITISVIYTMSRSIIMISSSSYIAFT